ncbi:MAG: hypothetical protein F6K65_09080 [Moorea sp. SIO3C2]|nr:hypothetical protein [Moorena sp. SIO3C2]
MRFPHLIIKFATGRTSGTQDCFPSSDFCVPSSVFPLLCSLLPKNPERKKVPNSNWKPLYLSGNGVKNLMNQTENLLVTLSGFILLI